MCCIVQLTLWVVMVTLCALLCAASIPEAGQASVQPHPPHPGSQGGHEEQPLTLQRLLRPNTNHTHTCQRLLLVCVGWSTGLFVFVISSSKGS